MPPLIINGQSEATSPHRPEDEIVTFNLEDDIGLLQPGTNIFAVQGLNNWFQSDDFLIHSQLRAGDPRRIRWHPPLPPTPAQLFYQSRPRSTHAFFTTVQWGPLATVDYHTPNIAITKIHYNPSVDPGEDTFPAK